MKICTACTLEHPKESFGGKQWQHKLHERRCKECIANNQVAQLIAPSCFICLGVEADDDLECPWGDCLCQGMDTGFIHLSCLIEYAQKKKQELDEVLDESDFCDFIEPWEVCTNFKQYYQNTHAVDIANKCVSYVERERPNYRQRKVEALSCKLSNSTGPS